ncbi:MAG TPA: HAMP domain-containing sensor histidine kinase [Bacteroidales bacterium]|nr:HAMP domain-containing sensor histidine kinase [Bacteroidales bacterium]
MFDFFDNDVCAGENSELIKEDKGKAMNSLENILINCPTLLTGMSHEMRTHMNAIVAFSFLMKESDNDNPEREEFSNQILSSCEQLISLFDSFLDSAIIDTGNSKSESKICNLDNVLDDLLSEFRDVLNKEDHNNVELITEIQFSNSAEVFIDKNRVFRVIRSLFQNSIKNTKSGYIKVGYSFRDDKLTFYVLDSGQGYFKSKEFFHSEDLNESLLRHNDTYTAINITLAKKIIQMLGGTIWIECNGLTGAGIYFSIPAKVVINSDININKFVNSMIAI